MSAPFAATAGSAFNFMATALDASNKVVTGYTGTIHFTGSSAGTLPPDYTFVLSDNGTHTFSATLNTPGNQKSKVGTRFYTGTFTM